MASVNACNGDTGVSTVIDVDDSQSTDEISPLLADASNIDDGNGRPNPSMSIFSVSYSRKRSINKDNPVESSLEGTEAEVNVLNQIVFWIWNGSRYSGLLCGASSVAIYYIMEIVTVLFPGRSIPLFQTLFTRCTIVLVLSFLWLRRTGHPLSVPTHVRNLLIMRSLTGLISVLGFIYSVQNLPLSLAVALNFTTPIMASIGAWLILQEKLALRYIGGIACSSLGLLLIFLPALLTRGTHDLELSNVFGKVLGDLNEAGEMSIPSSVRRNHPIFAILIGIFSSTLGGVSYCLIRAGAKASDHPVYTVLSFGLLATPVSAICTFTFQEFVLPSVFTIFMMVLLGVLAFFAEIYLARGLQIEKVGKVTNILYSKVLLSQLGSMTFLRLAASFSNVAGCFLILLSICSTAYLGPEKDVE